MYLGVDIGTSGVKVSLVDGRGVILASAYRKFRIRGLERNHRELDPGEIGSGAKSAIGEVVAASGRNDFELILVSSLGEAIVPVDAAGVALTNCIVGSDRRGAEELEEVCGLVPPDELTRITGLNLSTIYSLNKILHLRRHLPEAYKKTWKFFCVTDYFVHVLTGEAVIDYSMASRTMVFDINTKTWSDRILGAVGIGSERFSTPVLAGTVAGTVARGVAAELGLAPNVKVAIGTHDHICNAIGVGAVREGDCSNAVGTTEGITAILGGKLDPDLIAGYNISCEPFVREDMYNTVAWHNTAGAVVNWFLDTFYGRDRTPEQTKAWLLELNAARPRAPGKLMVAPHFSGSTTQRMDDKAKGAILGLTLGTEREDIYCALLEGACYECRIIVDALTSSGIPVDRLYVSGGGSQSEWWLQAKADILDMPLHVAETPNTGALGAAVLASVVCGHHASLSDAARAIVRGGRVVEPIRDNARAYRERYEEYKSLYDKLEGVNHLLP